ncbi:hypothetical protein FRD01_22390 [Microvenator marinus]|uniref:Uncharacterized protein n=1 Tax=Microvenator marinus TaxID=2600177 RepID=A0A5B8XWW9_9DELT|nr:hypothetical protein [Microvenator marinus]QED29934.1 hypothetical protein FRD01_22390 [Microvenator marinus]
MRQPEASEAAKTAEGVPPGPAYQELFSARSLTPAAARADYGVDLESLTTFEARNCISHVP